jgi:hypothetical protein
MKIKYPIGMSNPKMSHNKILAELKKSVNPMKISKTTIMMKMKYHIRMMSKTTHSLVLVLK